MSDPALLGAYGGVGFLGVGTMGAPMALNLLRAGALMNVWNRTPEKTASLAEAGAQVAATVEELFSCSDVVISMLATGEALEQSLGFGTNTFRQLLHNKTLVSMGTYSEEHSVRMAREVRSVGGTYVEAPVSGSRLPAERGDLVVMTAGYEEDVLALRDLLSPLCKGQFYCGMEPAGLRMKHATNLVLLPLLLGLAESASFAKRAGLELPVLAEVLAEGQIDSEVLRVKMKKLSVGDYSAQGSIRNALASVDKSVGSAEQLGLTLQVATLCRNLLAAAASTPLVDEDISAVWKWVSEHSVQDDL